MRIYIKYLLLSGCFTALLAVNSCKPGKKAPDVSHIPMNVTIQRFDSALFTLDTNNLQPGLSGLHKEYPLFLPVYFAEIMNMGAYSDSSADVQKQLNRFLTNPDFRQLEKDVSKKFADQSK